MTSRKFINQDNNSQKKSGFRSFEALVSTLNERKERDLAKLKTLSAEYVRIMGREDPGVRERIAELESLYQAKTESLRQKYQRFKESLSTSDTQLRIQNSNERMTCESNELYDSTSDESIKLRMRSRTLDESGYFGAIFPEHEAQPKERELNPFVRVLLDGKEEGLVPSNFKLLLMELPKGEFFSLSLFISRNQYVRDAVASEETLSEEVKKTILADYARSIEEEPGILKSNASRLAPVLGTGVKRAQNYLQDLSPETLIKLAAVAKRERITPSDLIEIDIMLQDDGVYTERLKDSIAVCNFRDGMNRIISAHFVTPEKQKVSDEVESLDDLWGKIVKKHNGDMEKAREEYEPIAEARMKYQSEPGPEGFVVMDKDKDSEKKPESLFSKNKAVGVFELFNFDRNMLDEFLDFFSDHFPIPSVEWVSGWDQEITFKLKSKRAVTEQIYKILEKFLESKSYGQFFNEDCHMFKKIKGNERDLWMNDLADNEREDYRFPDHFDDGNQAGRMHQRDADDEEFRISQDDAQTSGDQFRSRLYEDN